MQRVAPEDLRATVKALFESFALPPEDAGFVADALVEADLMGVSSHGVSNYIQLIYAPGLEKGTIEANPRIEVVHETNATALIDGGGGMGHVIGTRAMQLAIEKARETGLAAVAVRNSRHYGAAGHYSRMAVEHDMIGLSLTNSDKLVAPTHGKRAAVGTNPIAVAVPTAQEPPFLLDMATSAVPLGKIMLAMRAGRPIPPGWAADSEGEITTDAKAAFEAFNLLPLGGTYELGSHKGYSLAMVVDILSGLLSGAGAGIDDDLGSSVGHFFGAMRIDAFRPAEEVKAEMDSYLRRLRETPARSEGEPVIYAGVKEAADRAERSAHGIPLHDGVIDYLRGLCEERGIEHRL